MPSLLVLCVQLTAVQNHFFAQMFLLHIGWMELCLNKSLTLD